MEKQSSVVTIARSLAIFIFIECVALLGWYFATEYSKQSEKTVSTVSESKTVSVDPAVPFTIQDVFINSQAIPYDSFHSRSLYDDYLSPLFQQLGMIPEKVEDTREEQFLFRLSQSRRRDRYFRGRCPHGHLLS